MILAHPTQDPYRFCVTGFSSRDKESSINKEIESENQKKMRTKVGIQQDRESDTSKGDEYS